MRGEKSTYKFAEKLAGSCISRYWDIETVETGLTEKQVERVWEHADHISGALNMFNETAAEIAADTLEGYTNRVDELTTPECHHRRNYDCGHACPAWFIRDARIGRSVSALRQYAWKASRL